MKSSDFFVTGESTGREFHIGEMGEEMLPIKKKDFEGTFVVNDQPFNLIDELETAPFVNKHDPFLQSSNPEEILESSNIMKIIEPSETERLRLIRELLKDIIRVDKIGKGRKFKTVIICRNSSHALKLMNKLNIYGVSVREEKKSEEPKKILTDAEFLCEKFEKLPQMISPRKFSNIQGKWRWKH